MVRINTFVVLVLGTLCVLGVFATQSEQDHEHHHTSSLHFNIPVDFGELDDVEFIAEEMTIKARDEPEETDNEDDPIMCETICRPMNETDSEMAGAAAAYNAKASNPEGQETVKATVKSAPMEQSFLEMRKEICRAKGGKWNTGNSDCDPFMKVSTASTSYDSEAIFSVCQQEHGKQYVPCNPYQALALAHLYDVPDHAYYWLWPGGRFDQVEQAAFKQEVGHNPKEGMDRCPRKQHIGFFHNWDEAHVDSWGCLHDESDLRVLCCRRA